MNTVKMEDLAIGYGHHIVADGLTATLRRGQLVALVGRNGVGKSTLLRTLAGFQPPLGGTLVLGSSSSSGHSPGDAPSAPLPSGSLHRQVAVVLTERPDVTNLTVDEVVGLGRSPFTGFWGILSARDKAVVADTLREVGIADLSGRMMQTLSDGERQKVMIAKALAQQTPVVILDEPTAFLDYPSKVEMTALLSRMARQQDKAILLSTHDLELSIAHADQLWLLRRTAPHLLVGTVDDLRRQGLLEQELGFK